MEQFTFLCRPKVIAGEGTIVQLPEIIRDLGGKKALLVADPFFSAGPAFGALKREFEQAGISFTVYDKITGEPATETGDECAQFGKSAGCDIVVGIGGGSVLDTAKAASVIITNGGGVRDYQGLNKVPGPGLPKVMIPTTAGTGSEVTFTAVFIRTDEKKKGGINSPFLFPDVALLDPLLTISLPPAVTASTGLDALCHAVESYTSKKANFMTEAVSLDAIVRIWRYLPDAHANGGDRNARREMLYGSFLAGVGLANAGVTAVHSISYPLGGTFGVAHGVGNGLLLPHVLAYNLPAIIGKLAKAARAVGIAGELSEEKQAAAFIAGIKGMMQRFGMPTLKELNIPADVFPQLADDALKVAVPIENNPRPIGKDAIIEIYQSASER